MSSRCFKFKTQRHLPNESISRLHLMLNKSHWWELLKKICRHISCCKKIFDPEKKVFDSCCLFTKVSEAFERSRFRSRYFWHLIKVNDNFGQEMLQLEMQVCIWTFLDQLASSFVLQLRRAATTLSCIGFSLKLWLCGVLAVWVKAKDDDTNYPIEARKVNSCSSKARHF